MTSDANAGNAASTEQRVSQGKAGESCGCRPHDDAGRAAGDLGPVGGHAAAGGDAAAGTSQPGAPISAADSAVAPASSPAPSVQAVGQDASTQQTAIAGSRRCSPAPRMPTTPCGSIARATTADVTSRTPSAPRPTRATPRGRADRQPDDRRLEVRLWRDRHPGSGQQAETGQGALALSGAIQQFGWVAARPRAAVVVAHPLGCGWDGGSGNTSLAGARLEPGDRREPDAVELRRFVGERGEQRADHAGRHAAVGRRRRAADPGRSDRKRARDRVPAPVRSRPEPARRTTRRPPGCASPGGGGSVDQSNGATSAARRATTAGRRRPDAR